VQPGPRSSVRLTLRSARRLLRGETPPRATNEWALRHLLHDLRRSKDEHPVPVIRVISFVGDSPALSTAPRLALYAAASGISTALVAEGIPATKNRPLISLWAAFTGTNPLGRGLPFTLGLKHIRDRAPQLLVSIVVFDGKSDIFSPPGTVNLASISSNVVTADQLAQLALQAVDGGSALKGVALVNPDPGDNSSGLVEDDTLRPLRSRNDGRAGDDGLVQVGARPDRTDVSLGSER
jgi:hypothetical protein